MNWTTLVMQYVFNQVRNSNLFMNQTTQYNVDCKPTFIIYCRRHAEIHFHAAADNCQRERLILGFLE